MTATTSPTDKRQSVFVHVAIEPLDVLFFRDGRPFDAGMRARGGLPLPQTLAGALRTQLWNQLGIDWSQLRKTIKSSNSSKPSVFDAAKNALPTAHKWAASIAIEGPYLVHEPKKPDAVGPAAGLLVPAPADLVRLGKGKDDPIERLRPLPKDIEWPIAACRNAAERADYRPLWMHGTGTGKIEALSNHWLDSTGLNTYLAGGTPDGKKNLHPASRFYEWENRVGVAINPDSLTAADSQLFSQRFLRLKPNVRFHAIIELPDDSESVTTAQDAFNGQLIAWGGEGKLAQVTVIEPLNIPAPKISTPAKTDDGRRLALAISPGLFGAPFWRPDGSKWPTASLVAAAVPGSQAISGWDLARNHPKPARHAVVPGSTFFYEFASPEAAPNIGSIVSLAADTADAALGYSRALIGTWLWLNEV